MDSVFFYQTCQTAVPAFSSKAIHSSASRGPFVTGPYGQSQATTQRNKRNTPLKDFDVIEVIDLTDLDQGGNPPKQQAAGDGRARAHGTSGMARHDYAKDGNHHGDDDDFSPIEEILSGKKQKGGLANINPSPGTTSTEQVKAASPGSLNPGESQGEPIVILDDESHDTKSDAGGGGFEANHTGRDSDISCDPLSKIGGGIEDLDSAPASGIDNQITNNGDSRAISNEDDGHQNNEDDDQRSGPLNRVGRDSESGIQRSNSRAPDNRSPRDETSQENSSWYYLGSPTEVASDDDLHVDYHHNDKGVDDGFQDHRDDEQPQKPSPSESVSAAGRPSLPVSVPNESDSAGMRRGSSRTTSQQNVAPATKPSNGMDYVSRLSKEQQGQYAPLEDEASLRDIGAPPQQIPRPQKRSRSRGRQSACSSGDPSLSSAPALRASSSRANIRGRKSAVPVIHDGREVCVGDYILVECEGEDDGNRPPIARVEKIHLDGRLGVLWTYHPSSPDVPKGLFDFGPCEILLSDHKDIIRVGSLKGFAAVEENCQNCNDAPHWCWNKRFKAYKKKIIMEEGPAKRRRLGV